MRSRKIAVVALLVALLAFIRQRRRPIPMPSSLSFLLENSVTNYFVGPQRLIRRLDFAPGMRVLDAGCGVGRLTVPLARAVGEAGEVVALDGQRSMLDGLQRKLDAQDLSNVRPLLAVLGEGQLTEGGFDRVVLAMVLGEVREKEAALEEIYVALKPGGVLSVTEAIGDPDYRRPSTIRRGTVAAGFIPSGYYGSPVAYTANFVKPMPGGS
jgi:ubiquinone/menaquinone biosynthesis C-methylase UbiE